LNTADRNESRKIRKIWRRRIKRIRRRIKRGGNEES
jgi:hypothetical protein